MKLTQPHYRPLATEFWDDRYVVEQLSPNGRLVWAYLLTNRHTSQCGIYPVTDREIADKTGLSIDEVEQAMSQASKDGKVLRDPDTGEIFITNWLKFHQEYANPKIRTRIEAELAQVKSPALIEAWREHAQGVGYEPKLEDSNGKREPVTNPDVKKLIDFYHETYKARFNGKPVISIADAGNAQRLLKEGLRLDYLKQIILFGIHEYTRKGMTVTLKGLLSGWVRDAYTQRWSQVAWQFFGAEEPPTDKAWWQEGGSE